MHKRLGKKIALTILGLFIIAGAVSLFYERGDRSRPNTPPPVAGIFAPDAVRDLNIDSLQVGSNKVEAGVRGYMFFEATTHIALYNGDKLVSKKFITTQNDWMTSGYVPVTFDLNVPANLKGQTLTLWFIADNPSGEEARTRYWGTKLQVK